jgi:hypothetical protein
MITIKLTGGLGNQMFQYALGRSASQKLQSDFQLDISGYANQVGVASRQYALDIFNIRENFAKDDEISSLVKFFRAYKLGKILLYVYNYLPLRYRQYVKEPYYHFFAKIFDISIDSYLEGYWQSEKYFKDVEDILRQEFILKSSIQGTLDTKFMHQIQSTNSVSVHVRRGDYVTNKSTNQIHGTCSIEYYEKALSKIVETVSDPHLFIFSDDIEWAQEHLKLDYPVTYVSNGTYPDYEELFFMSVCSHNIIANSSFSWWGGWLNNNPGKIVIAPKKWFLDPSYDPKDLIPNGWITL